MLHGQFRCLTRGILWWLIINCWRDWELKDRCFPFAVSWSWGCTFQEGGRGTGRWEGDMVGVLLEVSSLFKILWLYLSTQKKVLSPALLQVAFTIPGTGGPGQQWSLPVRGVSSPKWDASLEAAFMYLISLNISFNETPLKSQER